MAQRSARRGRENQGFPQCVEHALGDLDPARELPYRPAADYRCITGRTDGSIRLRANTTPKFSLAKRGASTDGKPTIVLPGSVPGPCFTRPGSPLSPPSLHLPHSRSTGGVHWLPRDYDGVELLGLRFPPVSGSVAGTAADRAEYWPATSVPFARASLARSTA